jgi:biopolymer transport protein ExbD
VKTILLVFLIHNFSVDGTIVTAPAGCTLPNSTAKERSEMVSTVTITPTQLLSDGQVVASVAAVVRQENLLIEDLMRTLTKVTTAGQCGRQSRKIMIQSDRTIEFSIIKKVMYTCNKAGFTDFTVMVTTQG